jgi:hypothetical protein
MPSLDISGMMSSSESTTLLSSAAAGAKKRMHCIRESSFLDRCNFIFVFASELIAERPTATVAYVQTLPGPWLSAQIQSHIGFAELSG